MDIEREIATLRRLTVAQLQAQYTEVFGHQPRGRHRLWLIRRIAWRQQAIAEGDLSDRARQRAAELANEADLRLTAPGGRGAECGRDRAVVNMSDLPPDARLPISGTVLTREYKGRTVAVKVLETGFEYDGQIHPSLSAVAKAITGSHWNGFHFFGLTRRKGSP